MALRTEARGRKACRHGGNLAQAAASGFDTIQNVSTRRTPLMPRKAVFFKSYVMVGLMVLASNIGNVLLSKGMKATGPVSIHSAGQALNVLGSILVNPYIWLGIVSLMLYGLSYLILLSWADYSWALPASAVGYALIPLFGYLLLGESVSPARWGGVGLICAGVLCVGASSPNSNPDS